MTKTKNFSLESYRGRDRSEDRSKEVDVSGRGGFRKSVGFRKAVQNRVLKWGPYYSTASGTGDTRGKVATSTKVNVRT